LNYFIFANKPRGEYSGSFWDTASILNTGEYCFTLEDKLTYKPKTGDKIIFKEFTTQVYWGQATLESSGKEIERDDGKVIMFRLRDIIKWLYHLKTTSVHESLSNKDTRARIVNITESDYNLIIHEMNKNSIMSEEQQKQLKQLWDNYKVSNIVSTQIEKVFEKIIGEWKQYRQKIIEETITIDDYTNTLNNLRGADHLPGGYLCNFLERSTRDSLGSSKPGNATRFGVKLNDDDKTYTIAENATTTKNNNATKEEAETVFNSDIKPLLISIVSAPGQLERAQLTEKPDTCMKARQLLRKIVVLEKPMEYFYIYSDEVINALYTEFIDGPASLNLEKNHAVRKLLSELLNIEANYKDTNLLSGFLWSYYGAKTVADQSNPNVILYGSPGTGKTYTIKKNIHFLCRGDNSRYEFIQFHPSYTYEDFIEGIKPKGITTDGNIRFELVNGVFKRFCIKASKDPDKEYYFIIDEINRANLSSVFGEILLCLEKDYRHNVKSKTDSIENLVKTQYSSLIEQLDRVQKVNLAYYLSESGECYFGIPQNVYVIGMMNDVDKSIDTFDLALRRRFKWIRKDCNYDVIYDFTKYRNGQEFENINEYIRASKKLNNYISETLGLGKSYEFGHSFFMKISTIAMKKRISSKNISQLFELHLRPTLKEYLRAAYPERELDDKLQEALKTFVEHI